MQQIGSGCYARGGRSSGFCPLTWTALGAMSAYSQSKFLATTWAAWLRHAKRRDVVIMNPGPMRSTIGDAHVPLLLWPTFGLLKELLFPLPCVAAQAVLHYVQSDTTGEYIHIRVPSQLNAEVLSESCHAWLVRHTHTALAEARYEWRPDTAIRDRLWQIPS